MLNVSDAAKSYNKIGNYNYEFIIVKNRNSPKIKITLNFDKSKFYHLCGLHDLKIKSIQSEARENVFDKIVKGIYKDDLFQGNKNFSQIEDRVATLIRLEEMLDSNDTVFKFNSQMRQKGTKIQCDYIIKNNKDKRNYFYLISEGNEGKFFGRSCFNRNDTSKDDYSIGHTYCNVLYKAKLTLDNNGQEIDRKELYVADSFRKELEEMKDAGEITRSGSATSITCSDNGSNSTQFFSIERLNGQQLFGTSPFALAGAEVTQSASADFPPPIAISTLIDALKSLNEKIINTLYNFRSSLEQAGAAHERKISPELPFPKSKPAELVAKVQNPEIKSAEKRSSWIGNLISSARSESNAHNKSLEPKAHDKDKSL